MLFFTQKRWFVALVAAFGALLLTLSACGGVVRPDGGEGLLPAGASAPDLAGIDQNGATQRLSDERGHPVVVYFYPKDGTPGCTTEACAFRDAWEKYKAAGVKVFGVSSDTREAHVDFSKEHDLPFPLIADPDFTWATAFGVNSKFGMIERVSFLIDSDGKIAKVYPNVDPGVHAVALLADYAALPKKK